MDTENPIEGNPTGEGAAGANQPASQPVSQPSADGLTALNKRITELEAQNRSLQSGKDKRWNEVMPIVEKVAKILNVDPDKVEEAQNKIALEEIRRQMFGGLQPAQPVTGTGESAGAQVEVSSIVSEYGLDMNDPSVAAFVRDGKFADKDSAELAVARLLKRLKNQPNPTAAQAPVSTSGKPPVQDADTLLKEYIKEMKDCVGKPSQARAVMDKYIKLGVDTGKVAWT